ncbi:MAG: phosphate acyltransferase PlsX [Dehalococcoidia bacterium]|nr:phosphate acyltransferase PlsX [Dehalococcoidia bacterium]
MTQANGMVRIAVDAMGGDYAPTEVVAGAIEAAKQGDVQIGLVGNPQVLQAELAKYDTSRLPIMPVPSDGVIGEGEQPALALRQKPKASIVVATGLVKKGMADGAVTMGSTGAAMATAAVVLGMMEGISRPALGGPIIGFAPKTSIIDAGTNVDCRPSQLLSFAVIGDMWARIFWNVENPSIGLLSVGAEFGKGNRQVRETSELLAKSGLNFVGNVEPNEMVHGEVDVVVADGFVGNVVMKLTEGIGQASVDLVRGRLAGKLSEDEIEAITGELYEKTNVVSTHGGGPLLGVKGVSVIGHGRGKREEVKRAIEQAKNWHRLGVIDKLGEALTEVRSRAGVEE